MQYIIILALATSVCALPLHYNDGTGIYWSDNPLWSVDAGFSSRFNPNAAQMFRTPLLPQIRNHIESAGFWNQDPMWTNHVNVKSPIVPFNEDPLWATNIRSVPSVPSVIGDIQDPLWATKLGFAPKLLETLPINEDPLWATKPTVIAKSINEDPLWATKVDFSLPLGPQITAKDLGAAAFNDDPLWATKEAGMKFLMTGPVA